MDRTSSSGVKPAARARLRARRPLWIRAFVFVITGAHYFTLRATAPHLVCCRIPYEFRGFISAIRNSGFHLRNPVFRNPGVVKQDERERGSSANNAR